MTGVKCRFGTGVMGGASSIPCDGSDGCWCGRSEAAARNSEHTGRDERDRPHIQLRILSAQVGRAAQKLRAAAAAGRSPAAFSSVTYGAGLHPRGDRQYGARMHAARADGAPTSCIGKQRAQSIRQLLHTTGRWHPALVA